MSEWQLTRDTRPVSKPPKNSCPQGAEVCRMANPRSLSRLSCAEPSTQWAKWSASLMRKTCSEKSSVSSVLENEARIPHLKRSVDYPSRAALRTFTEADPFLDGPGIGPRIDDCYSRELIPASVAA